MNQRLSPRSEALIRHALSGERPPMALERARVKRGVLAAVTASTASVAASGSAAMTASKSAAAVKLVSSAWGGALGVKATTAVVLAVGAATAVAQLSFPNDRSEVATSAVQDSAPIHGSSSQKHAAPRNQPLSIPPSSVAGGGKPSTQLARVAPRQGALRSTSQQSEASRAPDATVQPSSRGTRRAPARVGLERDANPPAAFQQELEDLERIQAELSAGDGAAALALLDASGSRGTLLAEERMAAEVFAACQAGQVERARRAARTFLARSPGSFLAERVRRSCALRTGEATATVTSRH